MKNKLTGIKRKLSEASKVKKVLFSVVVIALLLFISISAVSAWVETISTIIIEGSGVVDSPVYTHASIKSTSTASIDLSKYFREAGNVHLSEASSADGQNFYFPVVDSTGETNYRRNNINDISVNYINFSLKVKSNAKNSFVFNDIPKITLDGNDISDSSVRMAITLEGDTTRIFSIAADQTKVVAATDGSKADTNVFSFDDYINGNLAGNFVFGLEANTEKELTISIWLQEGIAEGMSGKEISINDFYLVPGAPRNRVEAYAVTDGTVNSDAGGTVQVGNSSSGKYSSYSAEENTNVTVKATAKTGYKFVGWFATETGGSAKSTATSYTFKADNSYKLYARFVTTCQVQAFASYNGQNVSTAGTVQAGTSAAGDHSFYTVEIHGNVTVKAIEGANYKFVGWYTSVDGDTLFAEDATTATYEIKDVTDKELKIYARFVDALTFKAHAVSNTINNSATCGKVAFFDNTSAAQVSIKIEKGKEVTAKALPVNETNYIFVGWYDSASGGNRLDNPASRTYTFTADDSANKDIYARFLSIHQINAYAKYNNSTENIPDGLTVKVDGDTSGTSSGIDAQYNSTITVTANVTDATKYKFVGWYDNAGNAIPGATSNSYTFTVTENKDVYAKFEDVARYIYLTPGEWDKDDAWFAAYFFGSGDKWIKMVKENGVYKVAVPEGGYTNVIFCRMKSTDTSSLNWNNIWNQTVDLNLPGADSSNVRFVITAPWANKANGEWKTLN